jgi:putative sigma-54 modulation protein
MKVEITARHFNLPENSKEHIESRLERIDRYINNPIGCKVILEHENNIHAAEISLALSGKNIFVKDSSENLLKSFDSAFNKLVGRVKKFKDIRTSHN